MPHTSRVLFVSKPIAPPFRDGTRNLVRDLVTALPGGLAEVMTSRGTVLPGITGRQIYRGPSGHTTARTDALRLMGHLTTARLPPVLHWMFTPSAATRALPGFFARLRGRKTVWTLPSAPTTPLRPSDVARLDRVMVGSEPTRERLLSWGLPAARIVAVPPWLGEQAPLAASTVASLSSSLGLRRRTVVFCGDLGPGRGDAVSLEAFARASSDDDVLVIAARPKGEAASAARAALVARVAQLGIGARVRIEGVVPDMRALLAAADVVLLPATVLDAKVDVPLVLLEALALGKAVVVARGAPPAELADHGGAIAVAPEPAPLADALAALLRSSDARVALGESGRTLVRTRYAASTAAAWHLALYDELTSA